MNERKRLIAMRWRDIVIYGVISAAFFQLLKPTLESVALAVRLDSIALLLAWEAVAISAAVYLFSEFNLGYWKVWLRSFWVFPPIWVSALFSVLLLTQPYDSWFFAIALVVGLLAVFLVLGRLKSNPEEISKLENVRDLRQDIGKWTHDQILAWANEELPISSSESETKLLFGHENCVKRIFDRLVAGKPARRGPKSFALIGELGAGKTSIINVLSAKMRDLAPSWMVVKVDAWARSSSNIDEQILNLVLDHISKHIDVTGFNSLPRRYHAALQSRGGWWEFLSHLASSESDAESKLKQIDDLLLVLDQQLLIVIEDPDRGPINVVEARQERTLSLIDRLQQFTSDRIKVIVIGSKELFGYDHRVFEYRGDITSSSEDFISVLNTLTEKIWCENECCPILPNGKPSFTMNDFPFGTPRDFKFTLRDVNSLWVSPGELRGEVDLKQLILITFAKNVAPKSVEYLSARLSEGSDFTFDRKHYSWAIKSRLYSPKDRELVRAETAGVESTQNESRWNKLYQSMTSKERLVADYLIKAANERGCIQSILSNGRTNYLERILNANTGYVDSTDVDLNILRDHERLSDQEYLRSMNAVFESLMSEGEKEIKDIDVRNFLCAGHLSSYLYRRLKGEDVVKYCNKSQSKPLECWKLLADRVIEASEGLYYTSNHLGHPAGEHLVEIVEFLLGAQSVGQFGVEAKKLAFEIARKAVEAPSLAGGDLFQGGAALTNYAENREQHECKELWSLYRAAILNEYIIPNDLRDEDAVSWFFVEWLQNRGNNPKILRWVEVMRSALGVKDEDDAYRLVGLDKEAVSKVIALFNWLQGFGEMTRDFDGSICAHRAKWQAGKEFRGNDIKQLKEMLSARATYTK